MRTLSYYKSLYKRAKTSKGKQSSMNSAMLNLKYSDQQMFLKFQLSTLNN